MEVVVSGSMAYSALLPAAIASFTASATSYALGLEKFSVLLSQTLSLTDTKTVTYLILFGILFGLTGRLFAVLLQKVKQFMGNVLENPYKRIGFVSIPLAVFLFLAWNGRYCGLGTNLIAQAFSGGELYTFDWILKLLFTVLTLSIGFQGGEVTPLFPSVHRLVLCWEAWQDCHRWSVRHLDTRRCLEVQPILCWLRF